MEKIQGQRKSETGVNKIRENSRGLEIERQDHPEDYFDKRERKIRQEPGSFKTTGTL